MFAIDVGVQDNEFGLHTNSVLVSVVKKTETKSYNPRSRPRLFASFFDGLGLGLDLGL